MHIYNFSIHYDIDRKEVRSVRIFNKSTVERLAKAVCTPLKTLWDLKYGLAAGTLAGITASLVAALPLAVGAITGAAVGAMAWLVVQAILAPSCPLAKYESRPLRLSLFQLKEARRVNQILLKLLDTPWGKQWQQIKKKAKLDQAFKHAYKKLFGGTCLGQTHAFLKLMSTSHAKPSKELMSELKKEDVIRYQLIHHMRVKLCNWSDQDFYKIEMCLKEDELRKHHAKANEVQKAQLDAFKEEYSIPNAARKDNIVLSDKHAKESEFRKTLKNRLAALEWENPGKVIAASMVMKLKGGGHAFFVQCNGGHFRLYDINHGMCSYRDQDSLVSGIFNHLKRYKQDGIKKAVMETYAITCS